MFVSPRFRDIFASGPVKTRSDDRPSVEEPIACSTGPADVESIWLGITAAHRRAARTLTPESLKAADLYGNGN